MLKTRKLAHGSSVARTVSIATAAILLISSAQLAISLQSPSKASSKLTITTKSLPDATVGVEYYAVVAASGGEPLYDFSGTGLPPNLAFHYLSDTIGGKATAVGVYSVVITVKDSAETPNSASATFKLKVLEAAK